MAAIRVLTNAARCMQRLGYLKRLVRRVVSLSTSNLDNLGNDLTQTVTRKERVILTTERVTYIRQRLFDRVYAGLKKQADAWQEGGDLLVAMELQDLYLADTSLPSQTGKLVSNDWRKYPPLGLNLGLIRSGTYSAMTRTLSLLHLTPEAELKAFLAYCPEANPLRLSRAQALLLLYALLENDGEVVAPLFAQLAVRDTDDFNDRDAGDLLSDIYRAIIKRHQGRSVSVYERDRLVMLSRTADSIAKWKGKSYSGGGAREESSRPRLEPFSDIGIFAKPDPFRYSYVFTPAGRIWAQELIGVESDEQIGGFLATRFFDTAARAWKFLSTPLVNPEEIVPYLERAWQAIQSAGGYAPIEEMALIAGIEALLEHSLVIEPAVAREAIIAYQKANPYRVRFTVDRMGTLAHARFLELTDETVDNTRSIL